MDSSTEKGPLLEERQMPRTVHQDGLEEVRRARMANLQVRCGLWLRGLGFGWGFVHDAWCLHQIGPCERTGIDSEREGNGGHFGRKCAKDCGGRAFGERPGSLKAAESHKIKYGSGSPPQVLECSFMSWISPNPAKPCVDIHTMCRSC